MAEIITKARAGAQQQLSDGEFKVAIAVWLEVLEGHVPESRLNDAYITATRNRSSTFPLHPSEICTAWSGISEAERHSTPRKEMEKQLAGDVCRACWGTGYEHVRTGQYTYAKPCQHDFS